MGLISNTFFDDEYIQVPNLKKFCKERGLRNNYNKADLIKEVYAYAEKGKEQKEDLINWALKTIKAGSKEFCYRKIYRIDEKHKNAEKIREILKNEYPDCPFKNVLEYKNTDDLELINYEIELNEKNEVKIISFVFSSLVFEGERNKSGEKIIYPVFIDAYIESGFIFTRQKAKSTCYEITGANQLLNDNHIVTSNYAVRLLNEIMGKLEFVFDISAQDTKNKVYQMQYKLYEKYSFTPEDVLRKIESVKEDSALFVKKIFDDLKLSNKNLKNAIQDLEIFAEKYISINGDHEEGFKNDRDAYLIKVVSGDSQEMTRVDTASAPIKPLQCTEAFFDSKKAIMKSRQCEIMNLCFRRVDKSYFNGETVCFQFLAKKNYGVLKSGHYAEEEDIERVLRTIIESY